LLILISAKYNDLKVSVKRTKCQEYIVKTQNTYYSTSSFPLHTSQVFHAMVPSFYTL